MAAPARFWRGWCRLAAGVTSGRAAVRITGRLVEPPRRLDPALPLIEAEVGGVRSYCVLLGFQVAAVVFSGEEP